MTIREFAHRILDSADRLLSPQIGTTILIYHRVGGRSESAVDLDVDAFRTQLATLAADHRVISLASAVQELSNEVPDAELRRPSVVITFDDGTSDFVKHAVPALVEAQLPATLYACTRSIDEKSPFPWGVPAASWSGLRDAVSTGLISIESHTHTHALLDRLPAADVGNELDRSIELIGEHIGVAPRHFAYPKAVLGSPAAEIEVRSRFASAALARSRSNQHGRTDPYRLWRIPIQRTDDLDRFERKAAGGTRFEGELRHQLARWKYRGEVR